jgi:hypothetical protein
LGDPDQPTDRNFEFHSIVVFAFGKQQTAATTTTAIIMVTRNQFSVSGKLKIITTVNQRMSGGVEVCLSLVHQSTKATE